MMKKSIFNVTLWLLKKVVDDPVKLAVVLMFLALILAIWLMGKAIVQ